MKKNLRLLILFVLIAALCIPAAAIAGETRASLYIASYMAKAGSTGGKAVETAFSITGTGPMEDIGATDVYLYEKLPGSSSWTLAKYYSYAQSGNGHMMGKNNNLHSSYVSYTGVSGAQYYAVIYFWAGKNGGGDSRDYTTAIFTLP